MEIETDGDGFLIDRSVWSEEVMHELAKRAGLELNEEHIKYVMDLRDVFDKTGMVPPIREFAKTYGMDRKAKPLYELFKCPPMKKLAKISGLTKPTGCV